jgi:hypothetical protein
MHQFPIQAAFRAAITGGIPRRTLTAAALTLLAIAMAARFPAPAARKAVADIPAACDRACLENLVDRYLAAVVAHDPGRLPLSPRVRFTEMGQEIPVGDGLRFTASAVGRYKHYFADPVSKQVGFMATMKENGSPAMLGGRLRIQDGKITEIETVLYRAGSGPGWNDKGVAEIDARGTVDPLWLAVIPPAERASRDELIRDANRYFDGLENNDGKGDYNFAPDCFRVENGMQTTSHPELQPGAEFNVTASVASSNSRADISQWSRAFITGVSQSSIRSTASCSVWLVSITAV